MCSFAFVFVDVGGSPSSIVCCSKGDVGGPKRPEGNQWGGLVSVSWVIIVLIPWYGMTLGIVWYNYVIPYHGITF